MPLKLVTPPACEPVSLAQFKTHARISRDDEDATIRGYIMAARQYAESRQRRQLITATWRLTIDSFYPCGESRSLFETAAIKIPLPPLASVTSITYVDEDGATQTLDSSLYLVDTQSEPGRIVPAFNQVWPYTREQINAVAITFVAGYGGTPGSVPATTRQAIQMLASHYYENREAAIVGTISAVTPLAVDSLLSAEDHGGYK